MGWGLYGILNIEKGDKQAMAAQQLRNFQFFDAPVGLFFTVKKVMGIGARHCHDATNIMIAAKARGLDYLSSNRMEYVSQSSTALY